MGLFKTTREVTPEEKAFQKENLERLENEFDATKAMGVKKFPDAMQFIYNKDRRCFVVVEGPEETFKLRNPYIIDFDQVKDVWLEVEEYWTEEPGKFVAGQGYGQHTLLAERFDEVFWRYNLFMNIDTTHPYAGKIRYQMNYNQIITQIAGLRLKFAPRGLELNGEYRGEEILRQAERIEAFAAEQAKAVKREKVVDIATHNRPDSMLGKIKKDYFDEKYVQRMENVSKHLTRAYRIAKLLGKG